MWDGDAKKHKTLQLPTFGNSSKVMRFIVTFYRTNNIFFVKIIFVLVEQIIMYEVKPYGD